ncbi:putative phage abortive infection protein [Flavobacterium sp. HBTb2-11-1]|uniref:putative phage abortive infection protein n=1 Tax=Flavobacterium sp. HBTb2-11-1 TaxID=2692212 RepID=UPI001369D968|nr:putative phage abortive infection protein [Flavobacterium sp. HBTb2-11-1]MXO06821.1 hypothetical protein [Flavobacterium sp. HBTb2-11-1]
MTEKSTLILTRLLLITSAVIFGYFLIITIANGYWIWGENLDFTATGQFGDFIGGFLGTVINAAAFYFLYLTLNEQRKSGQQQSFETKIYDIIRLHRENVKELEYTKFARGKMQTSKSRKVFRVIVQEFMDCYHEVHRFCKMYPDTTILKSEYELILKNIIEENKLRVSTRELALLDIAFCFFYFGVGKESETILLHKFFNRYNKNFAHPLKIFIQLKPKQELGNMYRYWENFKCLEVAKMKDEFEKIYRDSLKSEESLYNVEKHYLFENLKAEKYYGGHQHRLGHYFRHLFQAFKFLSRQDFLDYDEKYFYAKSIRSQFSTYEQFILFFNSLSSLGMKWEYTSDINNEPSNIEPNDYKFITRYNLIKNLPGSQYYNFTYRKFYPKVRYEYLDDLTYTNKISNDPRSTKSSTEKLRKRLRLCVFLVS